MIATMKTFLAYFGTSIATAAAVIILRMCAPAPAHAADSAACYNVQDADARTYCLARAHREPSQCYSIQRSDLRSQCLAEVRK